MSNDFIEALNHDIYFTYYIVKRCKGLKSLDLSTLNTFYEDYVKDKENVKNEFEKERVQYDV